MRRYQLFEILDQHWCPRTIRDGATDFLECIAARTDLYAAVRSRMAEAIDASGSRKVIDLCSGGGGPWLSAGWNSLRERPDHPLHVALTDKFPSEVLASRVADDPTLSAICCPVDATSVPADLQGFRTIFASFHHFSDGGAKAVIANAVEAREGFATAEVTSRTLRAALAISILPFVVWLLTPGMRPYRFARLLFTYLLPAIPLVILWDGLVSCLRTRTPEELLALTSGFPQYTWNSGYAFERGSKLPIVYLIGLPNRP